MSGIKHGTRLEQLVALRARIDNELATLGVRRPTATSPTVARAEDPNDPHVVVPLSHVAPKAIRTWSGGAPHRHGPLPEDLVRAYRAAHRPCGAP